MDKPILDACCGGRMFHFDKINPLVEHVDIRECDMTLHGKHVVVSPDTLADFTDLPYEDASFHLVIFDPPHLRWAGPNSYMRAQYGELNENWKETIKMGFAECWRVLKNGGTLVFKWSEAQIALSEVLKLAPEKPVVGNKRPMQQKTHWLVFFKTGES